MGVVVFPDPEREPARISQPRVGVAVPGNVPADLLRPIVLVGLRDPAMLGAPVPEASVHEYGDLGKSEHEIGTSTEVWERLNVHLVSETSSVDLRPDSQLRSRVPPSVALHRPRGCWGCGSWRLEHPVSLTPRGTGGVRGGSDLLSNGRAGRCCQWSRQRTLLGGLPLGSWAASMASFPLDLASHSCGVEPKGCHLMGDATRPREGLRSCSVAGFTQEQWAR